jgi:hypothetical protein
MRRLLPLIAIAAWILMAGCSTTTPWTKEARQADTGILPGEQIVVLLSRYSREGAEVKDLSSIEARLEWCVQWEAQGKDDLTFLPPAALRKLVSVDTMGADGPKSPELLLRSLGEPVTATRLAEAKVRYLVLVEADYRTADSKWEVQSSGGKGGGGLTVGRGWRQTSSFQATILDLKHARIAGSIESSMSGSQGAGVGVILIIPFPYYYSSDTESRVCSALGEALVRFISGSTKP